MNERWFSKIFRQAIEKSRIKKEQKHSETIQAIRDAKQGVGLSKYYTDVNDMFLEKK